MQRNLLTLLVASIAVVAVVALAACTSGQSSSTSPTSSTPTASSASSASPSASAASGASGQQGQSSASQEPLPGQKGDVVISLDYSAGTGFEWSWSADSEGVVELVASDTVSLSSEKDITGGPLRDRFLFRALAPGEVALTFNLARNWEEGAEPAETQVYAFTVADDMQLILNPYKSHFVIEPEWVEA